MTRRLVLFPRPLDAHGFNHILYKHFFLPLFVIQLPHPLPLLQLMVTYCEYRILCKHTLGASQVQHEACF